MPEETKANVAEAGTNAVETVGTPAKVTEPDFKAQYDELTKSYKALQRDLQSANTRNSNTEVISKRLESLEESLALALDDLDKRFAKDELTEPTVANTSRRIDVLKTRKLEQTAIQQETDDFWTAVDDAGLNREDTELVEQVMKTSKTPREALRKLPAFIGKKQTKDIESRVKAELEKAQEAKKTEVKESGALAVANSPSSSSMDTRVFSEEEISDYAFWKEHKADIEKARSEGRIKE